MSQKRRRGSSFSDPNPWTPPTRSWKSSHGQGSFWGEIQVAVFSGLGAQFCGKKTGGPLTMYIHPKTDWLENPAWMKFVCPVEDGGFSNVMFFLLGCMVYLALRFNSWPLENDGTRSYFQGVHHTLSVSDIKITLWELLVILDCNGISEWWRCIMMILMSQKITTPRGMNGSFDEPTYVFPRDMSTIWTFGPFKLCRSGSNRQAIRWKRKAAKF